MTVLAVALLLSGCVAEVPEVAPPSPTPLTAQEIAELPLVDSTWSGVDSGGDQTNFLLEGDHTVRVSYNEQQWDEPADTWQLAEGVITISVHLDPTHGELVYTAPYSEGAQSLTATATTTATGRTVTVTLTRQ